MKKLSVLVALAVSVLGSLAEAQFAVRPDSGEIGMCYIQARLRVRSGAFIFGGAEGRGYGRIVCEYTDETTEVLPVRIETSAVGVGFEIPEEFDAKMFTSGLIGATDRGAVGFLGTYLTSRLNAGVGPLNAEFGISINTDGFSIPLTVQLDQGLQLVAAGIKFGEMTLRFDPKNLQARHAREFRHEFPAPPHRHSRPNAHRPPRKPHTVPVPPRRPKDLGTGTQPVPQPAPQPAPVPNGPVSTPPAEGGGETPTAPSGGSVPPVSVGGTPTPPGAGGTVGTPEDGSLLPPDLR